MSKFSFSKRDIYLDIAERYEKYITLGVIKLGEKLPSVREAAAKLRVNPNTVQRAYSLLEDKGLIRSIPKKGAFAIAGQEDKKDDKTYEAFITELLSLKELGETKERLISIIEEVYRND
jgi:GntR family transcriptional regulator